MTHADPTRSPTRVLSRERKTSPLALIIFALVYVGILAITFAPQGTLRAQPATQQVLLR